MKILCPVFKNGGVIPKKYTGQGKDISPGFVFKCVPKDVNKLKFRCVDPDASGKPWTHWDVDLKPGTKKLGENIGKKGSSSIIKTYPNSWGKKKYQGPLPPKGDAHKYNFILFAIKGDKIVDKAKYAGYYSRD